MAGMEMKEHWAKKALELLEGLDASKGAKAERIKERAQRHLDEIWAKKVTSENEIKREEARKQSRSQAKEDGYTNKNTPKEVKGAKESLQNTVSAGHTIPDWLKTAIDEGDKNIQTVAVARLIDRIAATPLERQNDPNFLLHERAKAYWGTPWSALTYEQTIQEQSVLRTVDKKIYEIIATTQAIQAGEYVHILQYNKPEKLWEVIDDTFDIYQTEKFSLRLGEKGEDLTKEEIIQRKSLDIELRKIQDFINAHLLPEEELNKLKEFHTRLSTESGKSFRSEDVEKIRSKIETRIQLLEKQIERKRSGPAGESATETSFDDYEDIFGREAGQAIRDGMKAKAEFTIDPKEARSLISEAATPGLADLAREVLDLNKYQNLTTPDVNKLLAMLNTLQASSAPFEAAHGKMIDILNAMSSMSPDEVKKLDFDAVKTFGEFLTNDRKLFDRIREALTAKQYEFVLRAGRLPGRSYFYDNPDKKMLIDQLTKEDFYKDGRNNDNIYEVFWDILSKANIDPSREFHEVFDFIKEQDLTTFIEFLKHRGKELGVPREHVGELLNRLSRMYKLNEIYHDCIMLAEGGSPEAAEQIAKYLGQFLDTHVGEMFEAIPGIQEAYDCQTSEMYRIVAEFKNRVDTETMKLAASSDGIEVVPKMGKPSLWQQRWYDRFKSMVMSGEFQDLKDMKEKPWKIEVANKFAFGFNIASGQFSQELTRITGAFGFLAGPYDHLKLDKYRGLIIKFGVGKPGFAMLYFNLTGDIETAREIAKNPGSWTVERALQALEMAETDPRFEDSIVRRRNVSQATMYLGAPAGWTLNAAVGDMDDTAFNMRGAAVKIEGIWGEIEDSYKKQIALEFEEKTGRKATNEDVYKGLMEQKEQMHDEVKARVRELLSNESLNTSPVEMVYLWSGDPALTTKPEKSLEALKSRKIKDQRTELLTAVIRKIYGEQYLNRIMTNDPNHGFFTVHSSDFRDNQQILSDSRRSRATKTGIETKAPFEVRAPKEVFYVLPENRFTTVSEGQKFSGEDRTKAVGALARWREASSVIEHDLLLVEARRKERIWRTYDEMKKTGNFAQIDTGIQDSDFSIIEKVVANDDKIPEAEKTTMATLRKEAAREYWKGIKKHSLLPRDRKESGTDNFIDWYTKRVATGKEAYIPYTTDIPLKYYKWWKSGGRGFSRRWGDVISVLKAQTGAVDVLYKIEAHPDFKQIEHLIKDKVTIPMSAYWDLVAQVNSGMLINDMMYFYEHNKFHDYGGPVSAALRSHWIQEKLADSDLYKSFLVPSVSKVIWPDGESLSPSERMRIIDDSDGINILPKGVLPFGWGWGGEQFTRKALKKKHRALPNNVITEVAMWIPFVMPGLMLIEGFRRESEEDKQR